VFCFACLYRITSEGDICTFLSSQMVFKEKKCKNIAKNEQIVIGYLVFGAGNARQSEMHVLGQASLHRPIAEARQQQDDQ
jgi:hypothetical protein